MFVKLAIQAWGEMRKEWKRKVPKTSKGAPTVMTAMYDHGDKELYFSSSVRKNNPAESWLRLFPPIERTSQLVVKALQECGLEDGGDTTHTNKANCGEMLVMHQWAVSNPGKGLHELRDFWLVTVSRKEGHAYVKSPCDANDKGCQKVLGPMGLDVIAEGIEISPEPVGYSLAFRPARQISITETSPCVFCCGRGYQEFGGYHIPCCVAPTNRVVQDTRALGLPLRDEKTGFLRTWYY
jgi:hypothetical protein